MKNYRVPLQLITLLADGQFHSGEQLGARLNMSRAAINKHIQTLRDWGVEIFPVSGKGYSLPAPLQLLDEQQIRDSLQPGTGRLFLLPIIDSTNQYLLDPMRESQPGDICITEYQYAGRGRRGRQWISPFGSNINLSLFWRLEQGHAAATGLSLVVGLVIAELLQGAGVVNVKVKWPNDIYVNERKLAGILVELSGKMGDSVQLVIGVGINLGMGGLATKEITHPWINLQEVLTNIDRNQLIIDLIATLRTMLLQFEQEGLSFFLPRWNALDNFINRPVKLLIGEHTLHGISRGIDEQGALLLDQEGKINRFVGGEISLRCDEP